MKMLFAVTGAGRGIGRVAASALADARAHVTLAARTASEIEDAAEAIRTRGQPAESVPLDVTNIEDFRTALAERAPFQVLVNNAGMNRPAPLIDVKVEDFDAIMGLNVRAAFFVVQAVAKPLIATNCPARSSPSRRKWAMSVRRAAQSIARRNILWRASPRRWPSSWRHTIFASIRSDRHFLRRL